MKLLGLDRAAAIGLVLINGLLLLTIAIGDRRQPQVKSFSWGDHQIGPYHHSFALTFDRAMDQDSVIKNLMIEPPLAGNVTWQGRTMIYRLSQMPPYGEQGKISLKNAVYQGQKSQRPLKPFQGNFQTRDEILAYIGLEDERRGRLILKNLTTDTVQSLTPEDLTVTDFKIIKDGAQILFSAFEFDPTAEKLYAVNTGLVSPPAKGELSTPGRLLKVLGDEDYIQSRFVASDDGRTLVIYRQARKNPGDRQLWAQVNGGPWQPLALDTQNFKLSPDGRKIAFIENNGLTLATLNDQGKIEQPRLFFPDYVEVLGFSQDSQRLALLKYRPEQNQNTLMIFDGTKERAIKQTPPLIECQFEPLTQDYLYCLTVEIKDSRPQPSLGVIDLQAQRSAPLIYIPRYSNLRLTMTQDGQSLIFDQTAMALEEDDGVINHNGQAIAAGLIWSIPLTNPRDLNLTNMDKVNPVKIGSGMNPRSMP